MGALAESSSRSLSFRVEITMILALVQVAMECTASKSAK